MAIFTQDMDGALTCIATNGDGCATGFHSCHRLVCHDWYGLLHPRGRHGGSDFVISASCDDSVTTSPSNDECEAPWLRSLVRRFVGNLCGANAEEIFTWNAGTETAYGVFFTFNSARTTTRSCSTPPTSDNDDLGFMMLQGNTCDDIEGFVGLVVTGTCAGSVESFVTLEPDTDYYFLLFTTDQSACGEFEFTTTGIILGCTDATADNYNPEANQDDSSCTFSNTPANDECSSAIALECNTVVTGSTGGATVSGAPNGVAGCAAAPGPGVWYTFVGDGQLHNFEHLRFSHRFQNQHLQRRHHLRWRIDCSSSGRLRQLGDCGLRVGGGSWDSEISWSLVDAGDTALSGGAPSTGSVCLPEGDYTLNMVDAYGDGWNGGSASFTDGLGDVGLTAGTLETGRELALRPSASQPTAWTQLWLLETSLVWRFRRRQRRQRQLHVV